MTEPTKIYLAKHTYCIYESAMYTISTHRTREGAQAVIDAHKAARFAEHSESYKDLMTWYNEEGLEPGLDYTPERAMGFEKWEVEESELLE